MTSLITGAAGFIGSHLVDKLLSMGNNVIGIDNYDDFYPAGVKHNNLRNALLNNQFKLVSGDIRDKNTLDKIFQENSIDSVFHLAAKAGVRPSINNPKDYFDVNVNGTVNLLEKMREFKVDKLIFTSSSSIYGNDKNYPFSEESKSDYPISPYAASKKAGELVCHTYNHLFGINIFCMRLFTVYGPRQRPDLAIYKFTKSILEGEKIKIYGDGSSQRDYTFISDIIDGLVKGFNNLNGFQIFNLGGSRTIKLIDLIQIIEESLKIKAKIDYCSKQAGDVDLTFADVTKAQTYLGYNPNKDLSTGIKEFVSWYTQK